MPKARIPADLRRLMRLADKARRFPVNTCPASRHVQIMADALAEGQTYHMFEEEPQHCARSLLETIIALWQARTELANIQGSGS